MLSGSELLIAGLFVAALLLMSIVDIALSSVTRIAVRRLLESPKIKTAPALVALVENRDQVLLSVHIFLQLLIIAGSVFLFGAFSRREVPLVAGMPGTIVLMFILILIFRQLIPRIVATRDPEMVLVYLRPFLQITHLMMRPFSNVLMRVMHSFQRWEDQAEPDKKEEETSDEEIQAFIDVGQEEGILESKEGEMIQSIVQFGDKVAREVMTARTQIVAIEINAPVDKLVDLIVSKRHTRIPVFREDIDNIEGIIHERDLLSVWQKGEKIQGLRSLIKPVNFVPETKPIDDLLAEMKEKGDQIVLVVDEYGGVSGLITMKDLVEEIIGNIRDDSEGDGEKIIEESPGVFIVPGRTELNVLEGTIGMPLVEDTECTTVAGVVVQLFGKLPSPGEMIEHDGIQIEVLDADRRRVKRLRMKVVVPHRMTG